jgi:hypothetical protein
MLLAFLGAELVTEPSVDNEAEGSGAAVAAFAHAIFLRKFASSSSSAQNSEQ